MLIILVLFIHKFVEVHYLKSRVELIKPIVVVVVVLFGFILLWKSKIGSNSHKMVINSNRLYRNVFIIKADQIFKWL